MTKYDAKALQTKLLQALDEYGDYNADNSEHRETVETIRRYAERLLGGPSEYFYYAPDHNKRYVRMCGPIDNATEESYKCLMSGWYKLVNKDGFDVYIRT